ncbi:MAG: FAD-binding protein [Planctomycetes bacterium]|nr:FAD-binding protein [Planctomycetota bacterium]
MTTSSIEVAGAAVPVHRANTIIVGAGAAGMGCAVQLVRFLRAAGVEDAPGRVLVVTAGLSLGASRMSGSDKQTYYKMGTSPRVPDSAEDFARTLTAFGCCHGDTALVEGTCSLRAFYNLVEAGVPFPHDAWGAFIGYKTDHDPCERATSAGPKTSRFMSECLEAEARRMGVRIIDDHPVVKFLTSGSGPERCIVAMLCINRSRLGADDRGLACFLADNWVLAAGGPGEIYEATVYPRGQVGLHGAALEAGLTACNLTESQFGLASIKFRWNVSGRYMQAVPRIFSTGPGGPGDDEREFLAEYFDDIATLATNVFLKGYQWPFDAQRIAGGQSSLIDMAVHQETVVRGRRVWMDFLHNPRGPDGWEPFGIDRLAPEARQYLRRTGATQERPIERLAHMNGPAIEIYAENGIDLRSEPLEIALCAQHMNGGFAVDKWWRSSVRGVFVVGEMAGTHGVKRPGGAALNAGQVGAMRAAEYIASVRLPRQAETPPVPADLAGRLGDALDELRDMLRRGRSAAVAPGEALEAIRRRMTRYGGHLRSRETAARALREAVEQYRSIAAEGLRIDAPAELPEAVQVRQQCLTHAAILKAVCGMFDRGAGSRGSHCILDEDGIEMHPALIDPRTDRPYRFRPENEALRDIILTVRYDEQAEDLFELSEQAPRPIPDRQVAFEPAWAEFRRGRIFEI